MVYDTNTWLKRYGRGYGVLSKGERRAIFDFTLLWSLYESQVLACNGSVARMIEKIDDWQNTNLLSDLQILDAWHHFHNRLVDGDNTSYHFEGLRLQGRNKALVNHNLLSAEISLLDRHKTLAHIIYRIRNNFLHGEKWSYGLSNQQENFQHAGQVLMVWMDFNESSR